MADTATTVETVYVNGVLMNTLRWNLSTKTGRYGTPDVVGDNLTQPFGIGSVWQQKSRGPRREIWGIDVYGADDTGHGAADRRGYLNDNIELLKTAFSGNTGRLLTLERNRLSAAGLVQTFALGEASLSSPTVQAGGTRAVFTADVLIPSGVWEPSASTVVTLGVGTTTLVNPGNVYTLPSSLVFAGPGTITNVKTAATLTVGAACTVNPQTHESTVWAGLTHNNSRWLFDLDAGTQNITVTGSTVTLTYKPAYL